MAHQRTSTSALLPYLFSPDTSWHSDSASTDHSASCSSKSSQASSEVEDYIFALILREADLHDDAVSLLDEASSSTRSEPDETQEKQFFYPVLDEDGCKIFVVL